MSSYVKLSLNPQSTISHFILYKKSKILILLYKKVFE